jgi:flagellar basal body-associated protein FliL
MNEIGIIIFVSGCVFIAGVVAYCFWLIQKSEKKRQDKVMRELIMSEKKMK